MNKLFSIYKYTDGLREVLVATEKMTLTMITRHEFVAYVQDPDALQHKLQWHENKELISFEIKEKKQIVCFTNDLHHANSKILK